jgi:hypothetical protein
MIEELFASVGLLPRGPVPWNIDLPDAGPGVYVIVSNGEVVYIGQTTRSLAQRLRAVYRHQYGAKSLRSGEQDMSQPPTSLSVYWAPTDDPRGAAADMLRWFSRRFTQLPLGNRKLLT